MPLYDYDCTACGRRIEVVHGVHAAGPTHCPSCGGGPLRKAITAPAVHFKGSGWAKKERRATVAPGAPKTAAESEATNDASSTDKDATTRKGSGSADAAGAAEPASNSAKPSDAGTVAKTGA